MAFAYDISIDRVPEEEEDPLLLTKRLVRELLG